MTTVISVRFPTSGRAYYFDPGDFELHEGDSVIVETARGTEFGEIVKMPHEVADEFVVQPLKPIVRIATDEDKRMREEYSSKEGEAFEICKKKIAKHQLDMKLIGVEYSFDGSKVVFFFTADERVDFRELVKDLASEFRTRIELRQIGVRDEAKLLGGLGPCGRPVCCNSFLDTFRPVSIKMAKEQNLSLSPTKISGLCGRLMCCLQYEEAAYEETKQRMPRVGKDIQTPDGIGHVVENNAITEKTKVKMTLPDGTVELREYHYTLLAQPGEPLPVPPPSEEKEPEKPTMRPEYIPPETPKAQADSEKPKPKRKRSRKPKAAKPDQPKQSRPDSGKKQEKTAGQTGRPSAPAEPQQPKKPAVELEQKQKEFSKNAKLNSRRRRRPSAPKKPSGV
ncbi:MAG: stage 0 sporulation protein [Clostridia bacterium]|nr:stage 0 sporulation protein [Clostridia bacterium]MBR0443931.1 stage 0 sporulation protein [Clostridia bacterium]